MNRNKNINMSTKLISVLTCLFLAFAAVAEDKINMNFKDEELIKVIEGYAKFTGQKFVVDPAVRGKITILLPEPVSREEAFNQLSSALAINGYAISKQGDTMIIKSARNIQRDLIEVTTDLPTLTPERMVTWIYKGKNISADNIVRELRIFPSKDGEISTHSNTNQLIISDWASNIHRMAEILKEIDRPVDIATSKIVEKSLKERELRSKESAKKEMAKTKIEVSEDKKEQHP